MVGPIIPIYGKASQMRRACVSVVVVSLVLCFSLTAEAELVYFLRPVTNGPGTSSAPNTNYNGSAGTFTNHLYEGKYTPLSANLACDFLGFPTVDGGVEAR
jgi:hypothetical protein